MMVHMQMFGLISLMVTVLLAAWWLTSILGGVDEKNEATTTEPQPIEYTESLKAAEEAAKLLTN